DAVPGEPGARELGKKRTAARDLVQFLDPSYSGNQRVIPFFEEHARRPREARRRFTNAIEVGRQPVRKLLGLTLTSDQTAEHSNHLQNFGDAPLIERYHGDAAAHELRGKGCLEI